VKLVTRDDIPDPHAFRIQCTVNGEAPRWLGDGDEGTIEIERVGALTNTVRARARTGGAA
jgi:2-keto-4-pentenoate hydratase/2-oxohepta-3-ene-1,7-dioic acid hydratase in catechol pathway